MMKKLILILLLLPILIFGQQNSSLTKGLIFHAPLDEWSNVNGENLLSTFNLTSGWSVNGATINNSNTFTSNADSWIYKTDIGLIVGKTYTIYFEYTSPANCIVYNSQANGSPWTLLLNSSNGAYTFTAEYTGLLIRSTTAGANTISIDNISVREVKTGYRDLVSGAIGTQTGVYPVLGKGGEGRRELSFDGVNDYVDVGAQPISSAFSYIIKLKVGALSHGETILAIGDGTSLIDLHFTTNGYLHTLYGSSPYGNKKSNTAYTSGTEITISFTSDGTSNTYNSLKINGVEQTGISGESNGTNASGGRIGIRQDNATTFWFSGSISMCRIFNYALTPTQIANYSKPEYPIEYADRDGAGNLCVLDLNAEGMTPTYWYDKTNSLTATVSGASLVKPSESNLGASYFNGTSSQINLVGTPVIGTGDFSFSTQILVNSFGDYNTILGGVNGFSLVITPDGYLWSILCGVADNPTSSFTISTNNWYSIAYTRTNGIGLYWVNGVASAPINDTRDYQSSLIIGSYFGNNWFFSGNIQGIRIYNRALSQDEITLLYKGGK